MFVNIASKFKSLFLIAKRSWRKLGAFLFGALYLLMAMIPASFALPANAEAEVLGSVKITDTNGNPINGFTIDSNGTKQLNVLVKTNTGRNLTATDGLSLFWSVSSTQYQAGSVNQSGLFTAGTNPGFYSGAINVIASWNSVNLADAVSVTINTPNQDNSTYSLQIRDNFTNTTFSGKTKNMQVGETYNYFLPVLMKNGVTSTDWATPDFKMTQNWTSSNSGVASITRVGPATGQVVAKANGTARMSVAYTSPTYGTITDYVDVKVGGGVTPPQTEKLQSIIITDTTGANLDSFTISQSATKQLGFKATTTTGRVLTNATSGLSLNWMIASTKYQAGTVNQSGLFTAGNTAGFYSAAVTLVGSFGGVNLDDAVSVTVNTSTPPQTRTIKSVIIGDAGHSNIDSFTIDTNGIKQLTWTAYDTNNNLMTASDNVAISWSADTLAGAINQVGLFNAGNTPNFYSAGIRISATYNGKTVLDAVSVTVNSTGVIDSLTLTPLNPVLQITPSNPTVYQQFYAVARDKSGNQIPGVTYTWNTSGVGSINASTGLYQSSAVGQAVVMVSASYNGQFRTASTVVTVINQGQPQTVARVQIYPKTLALQVNEQYRFMAVAYDQNNNIIPNTAFLWGTSGVGNVDQTGLYFAGPVRGSATVTASAFINNGTVGAMASDSATVTVSDLVILERVITRVVVTPASINIYPNQSQQFTAVAYDQYNVAFTASEAPMTWSVTNGYGSINQNGWFTAYGLSGTAIVQATAYYHGNSATGTANVYINGQFGDLYRIVISPDYVTLQPNQSRQFTATAYDSNNNVINGVTYYWTVRDSSAGTIDYYNGWFNASSNRNTYSDVIQVEGRYNGQSRYDYATVYIQDNTNNNAYLSANLIGQIEDGSNPAEGKIIVYTLTARNIASTYLTNVVLRTTVPAHTTFSSANGNPTPYLSGNEIVWPLGGLGLNETRTMTLKVWINNNLSKGTTTIQANGRATADQISGFNYTSNPLTVVKGKGVVTPINDNLPGTGANWMIWLLIGFIALMPTTLLYAGLRNRK